MVRTNRRGSKIRTPCNPGHRTHTLLRYFKCVKVPQQHRKRRVQSYWRWLALSPPASPTSSVSSNTNMSTNRDSNARQIEWSEANEAALLRRLYDYAADYDGRNIPNKVWEKWAREFQADWKRPVTVAQLTSKRDRFKLYYACYHALLTDTGLGWNPETKNVECSSERWAAFVQQFKFANKVRSEGIQNYDMLHAIFSRADADGRGAIGSGSASFQAQQHQSQDSMGGDDDDDDEPSNSTERRGSRRFGIGSPGIHKQHEKKSTASMNAQACSALMSIAETFKDRKSSSANMEPNTPIDYTLECMKILNGMNLPNNIYVPALKSFTKDKEDAKVFCHLPECRRMDWLLSTVGRPLDNQAPSSSFPPRGAEGNPFNVVPDPEPFGPSSTSVFYGMPPRPPPPGPYF